MNDEDGVTEQEVVSGRKLVQFADDTKQGRVIRCHSNPEEGLQAR